QPISPDEVVKAFPDNPEGKLGIARFKEHCCLRGLELDGKQVTPDAVVMDFPDSPEGKLGIVRFKEHCCLRNLSLNDKQVTPDVVVKGFQAVRARLELARFKEQCFLRGLPLTGKPVKSGEVVKDFPDTPEGKLGIARFIEQCCLKGLLLNGQQVTPDVVVKEYQAVRATLELGRFKEQCCLRGLLVHGQLVTPSEVVRDLPDSPEGRLGIARFKEECCMRNLPLNGEQVTPDSVIKDFPDSPEGKLGMARFKERCCLRGLPVSGQPVTPDEVVKDFQAIKATLELVRFKAECCLRGLEVHGQVVTPEAVVKDYECGGWLFESTIFHSQLALNARELNGNYLDNQKVLDAFNKVPGDHSARKTRHLIQRLKQSRQYDETNEAQDILQEAWQILNNVSVKDDEQHRLQCILTFMAMQHELTIDHQSVSAEQVLQSIKRLRCSFQNSRLYFFFLASCYITGRPVNGRQIHKDQVWKCLQRFPEGSHLRHALGCWFEQCSSEAYIMDELLIKRENSAACSRRGSDSPLGYAVSSCQQEASVATSAAEPRKQWLKKTEEPGSVENQVSRLNALTLKTLEIIQEINDSYGSPRILITGSYARFLQNLCSLFNDIDIICTTEASARTLFQKLQALNTNKESEIPKRIIIWPIPGCQAIKLPKAYNIQLKDGDLGRIAMRLQVNIDARVAHGNAARLAIHVPGIERLVWCLSFAEETRLLNDTLEHLAENLDPLTEQLKKGEVLYIPRTILFNFPQSLEERIYGLLMRSLLTLNKARKLIALKLDHLKNPLQEERQHLHDLTANLQKKLTNHACRNDFGHIINSWLSTTRPVNDYEIRRKEFITTLLAMMHSE
uniref:hypothetical protein n=1 Tax=Endozoicomonas sp. SESOKO1 TaxID=2828742 RepID=UPI002147930B